MGDAILKSYGFHTSDLVILPFIQQYEVTNDCKDGLVRDAFQRPSKKGSSRFVIPIASVEEYYRAKKIPEYIIKEKLAALKIPQGMQGQIEKQVQLNLVPRFAQA